MQYHLKFPEKLDLCSKLILSILVPSKIFAGIDCSYEIPSIRDLPFRMSLLYAIFLFYFLIFTLFHEINIWLLIKSYMKI